MNRSRDDSTVIKRNYAIVGSRIFANRSDSGDVYYLPQFPSALCDSNDFVSDTTECCPVLTGAGSGGKSIFILCIQRALDA